MATKKNAKTTAEAKVSKKAMSREEFVEKTLKAQEERKGEKDPGARAGVGAGLYARPAEP